MRIVIICVLVGLLGGCREVPQGVEDALVLSGSNKGEKGVASLWMAATGFFEIPGCLFFDWKHEMAFQCPKSGWNRPSV